MANGEDEYTVREYIEMAMIFAECSEDVTTSIQVYTERYLNRQHPHGALMKRAFERMKEDQRMLLSGHKAPLQHRIGENLYAVAIVMMNMTVGTTTASVRSIMNTPPALPATVRRLLPIELEYLGENRRADGFLFLFQLHSPSPSPANSRSPSIIEIPSTESSPVHGKDTPCSPSSTITSSPLRYHPYSASSPVRAQQTPDCSVLWTPLHNRFGSHSPARRRFRRCPAARRLSYNDDSDQNQNDHQEKEKKDECDISFNYY
ncbi:hypothetical protein QAD02_000780 [Eretmocerus hayati]|uniref:Uncharacterized protein n=1 Tax=Eretmocerus hayati TaxID=131215 RepID=A0ACC2NFS8_9HYME|nr:hypothetical protein QAD02_000780 [Eretmocerus hayati]